MARRRALYPIDTSDRLANVVIASLSILIVALLALILWMTGTGQQPSETAAAGPDDTVPAVGDEPPAAGPTPSEPGDGARATDGADTTDAVPPAAPQPEPPPPAPQPEPTPPAPEPEPTPPAPEPEPTPPALEPEPTPPAPEPEPTPPALEPGPTPPTAPPPTGDADDGEPPPPNPGRGSGLYSRDDPDRMPAIAVHAAPRDEHVRVVDLDGDGVDERVWAAIVADQVVVRVDRNIDGVWEPGRARGGAAADRLVHLRVGDLTGDGRPEVRTKQRVATLGESVTLWSYAGTTLERMAVAGGCWSGNNTLGLVGAQVRTDADGEAMLFAICEDKPLPTQQWPSALYRWRDGRWTFDRLLGKLR